MTTTTPPTDDLDLLRQTRAGNASAFQALYRRHQGPLYRFALLRCGAGATAADIVQEVFMGLLTGSLTFDPLRGQLPHFLFGVARNLILRHEAAARRVDSLPEPKDDGDGDGDLDVPSEDAGPLARLLNDELAEQLRRALALLPPHYRDAVILYELHGLSYLDIAAICQVDLGTVRSRLSRGRAALSKRLAALRPTPINAA